ncbi:MAG: 1,4-alpha-glucan branching protein GlgB [Cellulosilyticaceae bacterium]
MINRILSGDYTNPHDYLGMHCVDVEDKKKQVVRAYCPTAKSMTAIHLEDATKKYVLEHKGDGLFEGSMGRRQKTFQYELECVSEEGEKWSYIDPYQFQSRFGELDLYLFGEGTDYEIYNKLGAHFTTIDGIEGINFAIWAPAAKRVSVIGEFNNWDGRRHPMRLIPSNGIWELFVPGLREGDTYKFELKDRENKLLYKADPYAVWSELRPHTASKIFDLDKYKWKDSRWMKKREKRTPYNEAVCIYEIHAGSWKKHPNGEFYTYRELADSLSEYVMEMRYTHVELMGVMEHPFDGSWGYQVTGYFAPTSRYGTPDDFRYFVETMHRKNIGVILDWVPAHFPKDAFSLEKFDGTALYEHAHPLQGEHPQWGTLIFNFGRNEVSLFLMASALSWFDRYHIDGLRVDAVASMLYLDYGREGGNYIPNQYGGRENLEAVEFIKRLNSVVYSRYQGVLMIAEESTSWEGVTKPVERGGLGFGFKWNMGWMNDFLSYMKQDPFFRKYHHEKITFSLMYAFSENFIQALSHDEVVHGKSSMIYKMPGDEWQKFANLRAAYGYMYTHPGKKMLFMGDEFAQTTEWNEKVELDWGLLQYDLHRQMQYFVKTLNDLYRSRKSLWEVEDSYAGFEWIECNNKEQSIISFVRRGKKEKDTMLVVVNFTPETWEEYRIGVPKQGVYQEILTSDATCFGGSGITNNLCQSEAIPWNHKDQSIAIKVPPLGISLWEIVPTSRLKD